MFITTWSYILVAAFGSLVAHAQDSLPELEQSFAPNIVELESLLAKSAKLKAIKFRAGKLISKEACQQFQQKISEGSSIDPFLVHTQSGSTHNFMCGGQWGSQRNRLLDQSGRNSFGLNYRWIIQLVGVDAKLLPITHYLIDEQFQIVEIQSQTRQNNTRKLLESIIYSSDSHGNIHHRSIKVQDAWSGTNLQGTATENSFLSHDGRYPIRIFKKQMLDLQTQAILYEESRYSRADQVDWEEFSLLITHAWSGGFYRYRDELSSHPKNRSELVIKKRNGKKVCAYGQIVHQDQHKAFPSHHPFYYDCVNYPKNL